MKKYLLAALFSMIAGSAFAACPSPITVKDASGTTQNMTTVLDASSNCESVTAIVDGGGINKASVNASGQLSVTGATSSPFTPGGSYATLTASGASASVALPAGTTVAVYNIGSTAVSCKLTGGAGTAVPNEDIIQPGSSVGYTVGSYTYENCIDQSGSASNPIIISGGSGIFAGAVGVDITSLVNALTVVIANQGTIITELASAPAPQTTATPVQGVCTIATGGTPLQCISAAQNTNGYLLYVSPGFSNTDPIYCSDVTTTTTASTTGAMPLNPSAAAAVGGSFSTPTWHTAGKAVWCVGATAGDKVAYTVN